ncbi:MAG: hypothetical protein HC848_02095 [Limnobacter sp.]|nr:hypothetical protein [Limnobacter sp.]
MFFGTEKSGSGRLCVLDSGESLKGIGRTPLAPLTSVGHWDGCAGIEEAVLEVNAGEALNHLLPEKNRTTRVLAIIAPKIEWNVPWRETNPMIIVRVGVNLRPAHFLLGQGVWAKGIDNKKMKKAADRVFDKGSAVLNSDTLLRAHAQTAAALTRWRILHGSVNESNMAFDGGTLDFGTFTAQPHTAPMYSLKSSVLSWLSNDNECLEVVNMALFGAEHKANRDILAELFPGDPGLQARWKKTYTEEKNRQTLASLGIPEEDVAMLLQDYPQQTASLGKHLRFLDRLFYRNHSTDTRNHWDEAAGASFVDRYALMAEMPKIFFDRSTGAAQQVTGETLMDHLEVLSGKVCQQVEIRGAAACLSTSTAYRMRGKGKNGFGIAWTSLPRTIRH